MARRIVLVTSIAVLCSMALTTCLIILVFGLHPSGTISVQSMVRISAFLCITAPALTCPLLTYRVTRLTRDLTVSRDLFEQMARTDQLTGLLNRRGFDLSAVAALADWAGKGPIAALMCDIDFFKAINDDFGHDFGDAALKVFADLIAKTAPKSAIYGRQGGEEFVILLLGLEPRDTIHFAESLRGACADQTVTHGGKSTRITMSIGLALFERCDGRLQPILKLADTALYNAKRDGRDRVAILNGADLISKAA